MQHCCHRRGRHSGLRLVAAFLAHAVALAAAARIPAAVPLSHAKTSSSHSGNPANARAQRLDLAGAARSLLQSAAEDPVLPASPSLSPSPSSSPSPSLSPSPSSSPSPSLSPSPSSSPSPSLSPSPSSSPSPSLSPSPSSSPSPSPSPAPCGPHENPAAPYVPCGASPSPSPSPSPSLDPTLGSGSIKNSCGQPITFQAAYEVLSEQDGANCAELVPYFGPAASLFSELDPQGFLCLTGWEVIGPGETYQVPFATPIDPATDTQTPLLTRYPPCRLHNMFDKGYCSHHMSWWYTAHIATDEGTTYSLSRGKMGSSLRNATGMQLCWPAVPEECVWWVPLEPVQINYDPFKLGFDYQPNVLDWGTLGALELTCPDVAFNQSQGEPEQDPGPLPSDLAPLVVENACHSPIAFAAGFLLQQPYEQHPCRVVMQVGNYDAACITDYVTIPEGETVQLDTVWKQEGLARSKGLLNWPLPYNLRVSAYVAGSSPQHWLTNTSEALVWDDVPTPGLLSGGASVLSTAMTGTIWTPLVDATPHWRGDEYIAGPVDLNMTRADGTVVIRCEGYEASR